MKRLNYQGLGSLDGIHLALDQNVHDSLPHIHWRPDDLFSKLSHESEQLDRGHRQCKLVLDDVANKICENPRPERDLEHVDLTLRSAWGLLADVSDCNKFGALFEFAIGNKHARLCINRREKKACGTRVECDHTGLQRVELLV